MRKTRKLACSLLLLIVLFGGLLFVRQAQATNYVGGTIYSDSTWTKAGSPYVLTSNVYVAYQATLTIEPGVTVDFSNYQIQVSGTLNARGETTDKIVFTSNGNNDQKIAFSPASTAWSDYTHQGCIVDNAIITSVAIVVDGGSPKISNNYFYKGAFTPISINNGGFATIFNDVINFGYNTDGIYIISGSVHIETCYINGNGEQKTCGINNVGTGSIFGCNIVGCFTGILSYGAISVQQCNIMNNFNDGIANHDPSSSIMGNAIAKNKCGVSGTGNIQVNTITQNDVGIWGPLNTAQIAYNNIYGNYNSSAGITQNVHMTENYDINAPNNWWGSSDTATINQTIWDHKNDTINLGTFNFLPALTSSYSSAPSVPGSIPAPTAPPTPVPETSESPTPTITPTPTTPYEDTPTPYVLPSYTPIVPQETPGDIWGQMSFSDLVSVAVIVIAILTSIVIILLINKKFHPMQPTPPPPPQA